MIQFLLLSAHTMGKEANLESLALGRGKTRLLPVRMGWSLKRVTELLIALEKCPVLFFFLLIMNIVVWNCRGALKPNFQSHVRELVRCHNPDVLVVMETRIGGDRAKDISDRLPFDNAIHMETMGFAGGIWLMWNADKVEVV